MHKSYPAWHQFSYRGELGELLYVPNCQVVQVVHVVMFYKNDWHAHHQESLVMYVWMYINYLLVSNDYERDSSSCTEFHNLNFMVNWCEWPH